MKSTHRKKEGNFATFEIIIPERGGPTGIEAQVCEDIATRQIAGMVKYGTTVSDNPLSLKEWLQHAYEECLDQAVYLKRAISEMEKGI